MNFSWILFLLGGAAFAQGELTLKVETRVLDIDVIVRDPRAKAPVPGLAAADFELAIDGKRRPIAYFRREGDERRPLSLFLYVSLAAEGALRHLANPTTLASLERGLERLAPEDEVSVLAAEDWFAGPPRLLVEFSKDRAAVSAALRQAVDRAPRAVRPETSRAPTMEQAVRLVLEAAARRPAAHTAILSISDGMNTLDTFENRRRDALTAALAAGGVSFSTVTLDMLSGYAAAAAALNPIGMAFGMSVTGAANHFAKHTGGVALEVSAPAGLGEALTEVLTAYAARYSLGVVLTEAEVRHPGSHKLLVRLAAAAGKLEVHARRRF